MVRFGWFCQFLLIVGLLWLDNATVLCPDVLFFVRRGVWIMNPSEIATQPRLLILTPRYPYPVVGGDRLRIYYVCKELSKHYRLTLLSLCETEAEMKMQYPDDGVFSSIYRVFLPKWRSKLNVILALPTRTPLQVAYYKSAEFRDVLDEILPSHQLCLAHLIRTGDYVRALKGVPTVLEMTDAISLNYERVKARGGKRSLKEWVYTIEASRLLRYERGTIDDFSLVTLVSSTDRDFLLEGRPSKKILVCSNGVDLKNFPFSKRRESKPVIAYIGNMTSVQNMDACIYFAEQVMPLVRQDLDAVFRVVGKISDNDAERLRTYPNVEVIGAVDRIADAVVDARVGVCPVRLAAGVQNKVLEYMALGLPVITSSIGLEGFSAVPNHDVLVADEPKDYVKMIKQVWDRNEWALQIAENGRNYVERKHEWSSQLSGLVAQVSNLLKMNSISAR